MSAVKVLSVKYVCPVCLEVIGCVDKVIYNRADGKVIGCQHCCNVCNAEDKDDQTMVNVYGVA